ncbi:MAG: hypothetical protein HY043_04665 [Verrucomicrobia bacterium]|nr:hypothetical protein [Verrucomicrobiota bacterium]
MSIKISINAPGMAIQAHVKDEALTELIKLTQEYREEIGPFSESPVSAARSSAGNPSETTSEDAVKSFIKSHGAAELLTLVKWESFPDKILLLGAWHEARGGSLPWKSADMDELFSQAKDKGPANFPRDIKQAIKSGWIHAATARTYTVTGTGWKRIGEAIQRLQIG